MAIKQVCYATISFVGDGAAVTEVVNLNSSPFIFGGVSGGGSPQFFGPVWTATAPMPTNISNIISDDSQVVGIAIGMLGNLTYTFPIAIPAGNIVSVRCILEF